jgi:hypothetical protein
MNVTSCKQLYYRSKVSQAWLHINVIVLSSKIYNLINIINIIKFLEKIPTSFYQSNIWNRNKSKAIFFIHKYDYKHTTLVSVICLLMYPIIYLNKTAIVMMFKMFSFRQDSKWHRSGNKMSWNTKAEHSIDMCRNPLCHSCCVRYSNNGLV